MGHVGVEGCCCRLMGPGGGGGGGGTIAVACPVDVKQGRRRQVAGEISTHTGTHTHQLSPHTQQPENKTHAEVPTRVHCAAAHPRRRVLTVASHRQVKVNMDVDANCKTHASVPADVIKFGAPGMAFVSVEISEPMANMFMKNCHLTFVKKEVDPSTGDVFPEGEDEEYPLDEIEVGFGDYTRPNPLPDFRAAWDAMTPDFDVQQVCVRQAPSPVPMACCSFLVLPGPPQCPSAPVSPRSVLKRRMVVKHVRHKANKHSSSP